MSNEGSHEDLGLFSYKGFQLIKGVHEETHLDTLESFETRESDVFAVTYPKSGTTWIQYILAQIYHCDELKTKLLIHIVPWVEIDNKNVEFNTMTSPRTFVSHLPPTLLPRGLRDQGKVIYIARNPKDVAVSYYHFHNSVKLLENKQDFDEFLLEYLEGKVFGDSWFDHVLQWYSQKDKFDFLSLTFEEMIKDLRGAVVKICQFLGKNLDDTAIDTIVENSSFKSMKQSQDGNYIMRIPKYFSNGQHSMLRKGKVGDWKTTFTVAQSEMFDRIYKEKIENSPVDLQWDL